MALNNRQLRYLRGLSHKLNPVVMVADKGLTQNVLAEIETALGHHELVKVRLRTEREQRAEWIGQIRATSGAEVVHAIGQVVTLFRRNPKKPVIELPA